MPVAEFESFRAELNSLSDSTQAVRSRTVVDPALRERFRTLFRVWVSVIEPALRPVAKNPREVFKLSAELERLAQLSSKRKQTAEYRKRLRTARQLADGLALYLPATLAAPTTAVGRHEPFIPAIPDLPVALVPNPLVGWKSRMELFCRDHPFDKSVFIMIRYRKRTEPLIESVKASLEAEGLFGVVASEHTITDDLYNPIACLLCCSRGIAIFDRAEAAQAFNPNVAYELGMLHLLARPCLLLKHISLQTLQTDILMKLYQPFSTRNEVSQLTAGWIQNSSEPNPARAV